MKRKFDQEENLEGINKKENLESLEINSLESLFSYVRNDNLEALETLMSGKDFDLNVTDKNNYLPMHVAAANNSIKVAEHLIKIQGNAAVEYRTNNPQAETPLLVALKHDHSEMIRLLLKRGANIEVRTEDQLKATPLLIAAMNGYTETVKALVAAGANVEVRTESQLKATPLYAAAYNGHTDTVKALVAAGANVEVRTEDQLKATPLYVAAQNGHTETVKALVAAGADIEVRTEDQFKSTPLYVAAYNGHTETVKTLVAAGADIEVRTEDQLKATPLYVAAIKGHTETVKALVAAGANVEVRTEGQLKASPLYVAAENGHTETVKVLLAAEANIEVRNEGQLKATPLYVAAYSGHTETVKVLLAAGANVEVRTEDQLEVTPLYVAAQNGYTETVKALLAAGANIGVSDDEDNTPLTLASKYGYLEIVKLLLQYGSKVDLSNDDIMSIYLDEDFVKETFLDEMEYNDDERALFTENHPLIKNHLLGAYWWQIVLSKDTSVLPNYSPFFWNMELKNLFKNILDNAVASAVNFKEISIICKNIMLSKKEALNTLKNYSTELNEKEEVLCNRIDAFEELFKEIVEEVIVPIYGEDDALITPKLSLLALNKVLSDSKDYLKFLKMNPFAAEKAKIALTAKLLSKDQEGKLISSLTQLIVEDTESIIDVTNKDYHNELNIDSTGIIGMDIDNSTV